MRRDMPTVAELFRQDGYHTGLFGKWHLGYTYPDRPMDRGFTKAIWFKGASLQSGLEFDNDNDNPRYLDGTVELRASVYCTDLWFNEAISWMTDQHATGQPFFVYLPANTPHMPLWSPAEYLSGFQDKTDEKTAALFAMAANLDDNLGRLEQWLLSTGAYDNTIVVFISSISSAASRLTFIPSQYKDNAQLFCSLRWPAGNFDTDQPIATPTQAQDLLPTLLELCEVPPGNNKFDGASLVPLVMGGSLADRMLVVQTGLRQRPIKYAATVIWDQWQMLEGAQLLGPAAEPTTQEAILVEQQEVLSKMRSFYEQWWDQHEPDFSKPQPMFIGAEIEKPEQLSSIDWWEVEAEDISAISNGLGGSRGGVWHVQVFTAGEYEIELRRWPFHTAKALGSEGPRQTINGRLLTHSVKLIPTREAILTLNGNEQRVATNPDVSGVKFHITLNRGPALLQGWFSDGQGKDLCGAYYARVIRLS